MGEIVTAAFQPPAWLRSAHLQTVWSTLFRRPQPINRRRETLYLDDGDHLLLDWAGPEPQPGDLRVLLLHGLSGCSDSHYIHGTQAQLAARGIASVAMNSRGAAAPNDTALCAHAGEINDLDAVIQTLRRRDPHGVLIAMGVSLGGSRILNWLAKADNGALTAAVAVCSPLRLDLCADRMDQGLSRLYRRHLITALIATLKRQQAHLWQVAPHQARRLETLDLQGIGSFWTFDQRVIAPLYGFRNAAHYYRSASAGPHLNAISTPTLMIQAADDPFMSPSTLPTQNQLGRGITLEVATHGGHVGFVTGNPRRPEYWLENRLVDFATDFQTVPVSPLGQQHGEQCT